MLKNPKIKQTFRGTKNSEDVACANYFLLLLGDLYAGGAEFFVFFKLQMRSGLCIVLLTIHQEIWSTGVKTEQNNPRCQTHKNCLALFVSLKNMVKWGEDFKSDTAYLGV